MLLFEKNDIISKNKNVAITPEKQLDNQTIGRPEQGAGFDVKEAPEKAKTKEISEREPKKKEEIKKETEKKPLFRKPKVPVLPIKRAKDEIEVKVEKIMERNKSGASLKYGLLLDENGAIKPSSKIEHIPLFYLALPQKQIEEGIKNFKTDSTSEYEKKLFEYFILSIKTQMKGLELKNDTHPKCQERLKRLETSLKNIK